MNHKDFLESRVGQVVLSSPSSGPGLEHGKQGRSSEI